MMNSNGNNNSISSNDSTIAAGGVPRNRVSDPSSHVNHDDHHTAMDLSEQVQPFDDNDHDYDLDPALPLNVSAGRFPKWIALTVFSLIAWLATIGGVPRHAREDRAEKWALTATTLLVVLAAVGVLGSALGRGIFMGQLPEVAVIGVVVILWAGSLPVIMNPGNSIAVGYTDYLNANLYFSSWLAFWASLWIAGDLAQEWYGMMDLVGMVTASSDRIQKDRRGKWWALIATSLIVTSSSVRVYRAFPCSAQVLALSPTCRQTKFAISAGVIGTVVSMGVTLYMTTKGRSLSRMSHGCTSILMVLIWSFGLGYITFGSGPGQNIGNLYFSTWASFICSVLLAAESVREYLALREEQAAAAVSGSSSMDNQDQGPNDLDLVEQVADQSSFEDADL